MGDAEVLLVRRHVAAVRVVGDGDVAGESAVGVLAAVQDAHPVQLLSFARSNGGLDGGDVEDDDVVHLGRGHVGQGHPHFAVVGGREGPFALVIRVAVVEVARDHDLPGGQHRFRIDRGEDVHVGRHVLHRGAVVDQRGLILSVAEDVLGEGRLLRPHPVDRLGVRDFQNRVALHHVRPDPGDAGVGLVVHEQVLAVVLAVGE